MELLPLAGLFLILLMINLAIEFKWHEKIKSKSNRDSCFDNDEYTDWDCDR